MYQFGQVIRAVTMFYNLSLSVKLCSDGCAASTGHTGMYIPDLDPLCCETDKRRESSAIAASPTNVSKFPWNI